MNQLQSFQEKEPPVVLEINLNHPKTWINMLLLKAGIIKNKRKLAIPVLSVGTSAEICKLLNRLDKDLLDPNAYTQSTVNLISSQAPGLIKILAIAAKNKKGKYSRKDERLIQSEFTSQQLLQTLVIVFKQMQLQYFIQCVLIMKGGEPE